MNQPFWKQERFAVGLLLVLALGLRLASVVAHGHVPPTYDAEWYEEVGWSISQGGGDLIHREFLRPPLYPMVIALMYKVLGRNWFVVLGIQTLLGTLTCWLTYLIGKRVLGASMGLLSLAFCALFASLIRSSSLFLTECLFTCLLVLAIYLLARLSQQGGPGAAVSLGLVTGLAAMTKDNMVIFPILIVGGMFLFQPWRWPRRIGLSVLVIILFLLVLLPWSIRNRLTYGEWTSIGTQGGIGLYSAYNPPEGKLVAAPARDETTRYAETYLKSEIERSNFLSREAWRSIEENPGRLPRLEFLKLAFLWLPFDWEVLGGGIFNASFGFILPFVLWGMMSLLKRMKDLWILYLPILHIHLVSLIFVGSPRFRLPFEPFFILFSAFGVWRFVSLFKRKWIPSAALGVWLGTQWLFFLNSEAVRFQVRRLAAGFGLW